MMKAVRAAAPSFDQVKEELRGIARDKEEFDVLLAEKVADELVQFFFRKSERRNPDEDGKKEKKKMKKKKSPPPPPRPVQEFLVHDIKKAKGKIVIKEPADVQEYTRRYDPSNNRKLRYNSHEFAPPKISRKRCSDRDDQGCNGEGGGGKMTGRVLSKKQRTQPKMVDFRKLGLDPPPGMPESLHAYIESIGGRNPMLVIMKQCFRTDLRDHHDRLSIPSNQVKNHGFLEDEEREKLLRKDPIRVKLVIDGRPDQVHDMMLRAWAQKNSFSYSLTTSWNGVVNANPDILRLDTIIQIWSFRVNTQIYLALVKILDGALVDEISGDGTSSSDQGATTGGGSPEMAAGSSGSSSSDRGQEVDKFSD